MTYTLVVGAAPAGGAKEFYRGLLEGAESVVAADAAGEWCAGLGRIPDLVVGDFDSALPGAEARLVAAGSDVARFPSDKDATDLELAIGAARDRYAGPIVVTAAFRERLDHTLAALGSLLRAGAGARAQEPGWTAWACVPGSPVVLDVPAQETFSVLAIGDATGVDVSGAAWPLVDEPLRALSGRGVSNLAGGGPMQVSVESGTLVVILMDETASGIY